MNPINSTENIIFPPGNKLSTDVTVTPSGYLQLNSTYNQPLPTLVEAITNEDKTSIKVTAIVLINSEIKIPTLIVNQLFTISNYGLAQLQFFIHCSEEEIQRIMTEPSGSKYHAFKVEFTTNETTNFPSNISMKDIKCVQTFLWNIDPKTSRGTETAVISAV